MGIFGSQESELQDYLYRLEDDLEETEELLDRASRLIQTMNTPEARDWLDDYEEAGR